MEDMVEVYDDKILSYLKKDNEVETILESKIEELDSEKQKLSDKNAELKELENSYRDKLTHDSSTDEIREIADEIDRIKEELNSLQGNIDLLQININMISETKDKNEKSKEEYITNVSNTIEDYEKKLDAINKAIEVCDNAALKEAFEEEQADMQSKLNDLKKQREKELDISINNTIKKEDSNDDIAEKTPVEYDNAPFDEVVVSDLLNKIDLSDNQEQPDVKVDSPVEEKNYEDSEEPIIKSDIDLDVNEDLLKNDDVNKEIEIDYPKTLPNDIVLPNIDIENINTPSLDDNIPVDNGQEIIDNISVDASKISQILSSSSIMPSVYKWLNNNIDEKVVE